MLQGYLSIYRMSHGLFKIRVMELAINKYSFSCRLFCMKRNTYLFTSYIKWELNNTITYNKETDYFSVISKIAKNKLISRVVKIKCASVLTQMLGRNEILNANCISERKPIICTKVLCWSRFL
ncbi:MAG: hypothetical protein ACFWT6_05820 [Virgibacillus proomii]|jgi:hypothetical protein